MSKELPSYSSDVTVHNVNIQNGNFGASDPRNLNHPVLITNSYGLGINITPDQYSKTTLTLQCKANDTYNIGAFAYTGDVPEAPFDVLSDGQVECT